MYLMFNHICQKPLIIFPINKVTSQVSSTSTIFRYVRCILQVTICPVIDLQASCPVYHVQFVQRLGPDIDVSKLAAVSRTNLPCIRVVAGEQTNFKLPQEIRSDPSEGYFVRSEVDVCFLSVL